MSEVNNQTLPPGLPNAQQVTVPSTQTPPTSPMLSHMSNPPPVPTTTIAPASTVVEAPAPVLPTSTQPAPTISNDAFGALADDPQVRLVNDYLSNVAADLKLDLKRAVGQSVNEFDAKFIDTAYIREVVKDSAKAEQIIRSISNVVEYASESRARIVKEVYDQAGGEANWKAAMAVFNKTVPGETRDIIRGLLESGKDSNVKYAVQQILQVAKSAGVVVQHVPPVLSYNSTEKGYSQAEYAKIIANRNLTDAEYAEARRLRVLGKSQGL